MHRDQLIVPIYSPFAFFVLGGVRVGAMALSAYDFLKHVLMLRVIKFCSEDANAGGVGHIMRLLISRGNNLIT